VTWHVGHHIAVGLSKVLRRHGEQSRGGVSENWGATVQTHLEYFYRGADKSLVRPGRKQANVSLRMA